MASQKVFGVSYCYSELTERDLIAAVGGVHLLDPRGSGLYRRPEHGRCPRFRPARCDRPVMACTMP
ncbi:MAG: hypothetical protein WAK98_09120 [Gemmobacter sp.]